MIFIDWEDGYDVYDFFVPLIYENLSAANLNLVK